MQFDDGAVQVGEADVLLLGVGCDSRDGDDGVRELSFFRLRARRGLLLLLLLLSCERAPLERGRSAAHHPIVQPPTKWELKTRCTVTLASSLTSAGARICCRCCAAAGAAAAAATVANAKIAAAANAARGIAGAAGDRRRCVRDILAVAKH